MSEYILVKTAFYESCNTCQAIHTQTAQEQNCKNSSLSVAIKEILMSKKAESKKAVGKKIKFCTEG